MRWRLLLLCPLLVACASHGDPKPSAKRAAVMYMELHNDWDDETAEALWGEEVGTSEEMTSWFHDRVGRCTGFEAIWWKNELHARFAFKCERGELEIAFEVDETTGVVEGMKAGARGIEPPPHVRNMANQVVALANGETTTEPELGGKLDSAEFHEELGEISAHGDCRVDRIHLGSFRGARFVLECANGPMNMLVDLNVHGALRRFIVDEGAADTWRNEMRLRS